MSFLQRCMLGLVLLAPMSISIAEPLTPKQSAVYDAMMAHYNDYQAAFDRRKFKSAVKPARQALKLSKKLYGSDHETTALLQYNLGLASLGAGKRDKGRRALLQADQIRSRLDGIDSESRVPVLMAIGDATIRISDALEHYDEALRIVVALYGTGSVKYGECLLSIGLSIKSAANNAKAERYLAEADEVLTETLPETDPRRAQAAVALYRFLEDDSRDYRATVERAIRLLETSDSSKRLWSRAKIALSEALRVEGDVAGADAITAAIFSPPIPDGVEPVAVIKQVAPNYPRDAAQAGVTGYVELEFTIDINGLPTDVVVMGGENYAIFAASVKRAFGQWRFKPRLVDGVPTDRRAQIRIEFKL